MTGPSWLDQFRDAINTASQLYGVDPSLIAAVIQQESGGNPDARGKAGEVGLMQVIGGPSDPTQNILAGTAYLRDQLNSFNGNVDLALAAYNAGPGAVKQFGGVPSYASGYVTSVESLWEQTKSWFDTGTSTVTQVSDALQTVNPTKVGVQVPSKVQVDPAQSIQDAITAAAQAIANLPAGLTKPFADFFNQTIGFAHWLGQPNLVIRVLMGLLGVLLILVGLVFFGLSLVPKSVVNDVKQAATVVA